MIFTVGYLGGGNYPKVILNNHPSGWGAGAILNTNKPYWPKTNCWGWLDKLGTRSDFPTAKTHAVWADDHKYDPKIHKSIISKEFDTARKFKARHAHVDFYFSPICERDNRNQSVIDLFGWLDENADGLTILNSYNKGGAIKGIMSEVHGTMPAPDGPYCFSFDGCQAFDVNMEEYKSRHERAELFEIWFSQCNGKYNDKQPGEKGADTTKRPLRKAWPIAKHIKSVVPYATTMGVIQWHKDWIYKTHADQHSKTSPAPREGKPVMIIPHKAAQVELYTMDKRLVAKLPRDSAPYNAPGSPQHGWSMYRSSSWGYELFDKATAMQGNPIVVVRVGNAEIGIINPAFRAGLTR